MRQASCQQAARGDSSLVCLLQVLYCVLLQLFHCRVIMDVALSFDLGEQQKQGQAQH